MHLAHMYEVTSSRSLTDSAVEKKGVRGQKVAVCAVNDGGRRTDRNSNSKKFIRSGGIPWRLHLTHLHCGMHLPRVFASPYSVCARSFFFFEICHGSFAWCRGFIMVCMDLCMGIFSRENDASKDCPKTSFSSD
jgi:hypothetical protein